MNKVKVLFNKAERQLGMLKKTLDELANLEPGPFYKLSLAAAKALGRRMESWRRSSV